MSAPRTTQTPPPDQRTMEDFVRMVRSLLEPAPASQDQQPISDEDLMIAMHMRVIHD